tara:strand:- start:62 stop:298 length:237 start_codon:yes stop_codon:yes gene_type:complete
MPRENQEKLSGLWLNETKNGQKYFSGKNDGFKYTIFKNGFKEKDSQPDYILYREPVEEQNGVKWDGSPRVPETNELPF